MHSLLYLLEVSFSLLLFLGFYRISLARLTFFAWNRWYLVVTLLLSLGMPVWDLPAVSWLDKESAQTLFHWMVHSPTPTPASTYSIPFLSWATAFRFLGGLYWLLVSYHLLKLTLDVGAVVRHIQRNPGQDHGRYRIIWVTDSMPTSSFFRYIFLNKTQCHQEAITTIITHEQVHCQQWHSLDGLLLRFIGAFFWFNPVIRFWQKAMTINHEYIADAQTVKVSDPYRYATWLVNLSAQPQTSSTLHYFSYGQLKSRIIMINQPRTQSLYRFRFLLVAPLAGLILGVIACGRTLKNTEFIPPNNELVLKAMSIRFAPANSVSRSETEGNASSRLAKRPARVPASATTLVMSTDGNSLLLKGQQPDTVLHFTYRPSGTSEKGTPK